MNHLDNRMSLPNRSFLHPVDIVVNTLAVFIVCGLIYKGTIALFDADSGLMFRSVEAKSSEMRSFH
jgi:hypothetical protein